MTVKLKPFPAADSTALNELYAHVNQRYCLVQLPVPLPEEETARYLEVIRTGTITASRLSASASLWKTASLARSN
ncbi:MAG: hypothetical protein IKE68_00310 [Solobacterium sp.]|nr:hypothetical protein [Solobacterium sp.]